MIVFQRVFLALGSALRTACVSLEKTCSIGFGAGL